MTKKYLALIIFTAALVFIYWFSENYESALADVEQPVLPQSRLENIQQNNQNSNQRQPTSTSNRLPAAQRKIASVNKTPAQLDELSRLREQLAVENENFIQLQASVDSFRNQLVQHSRQINLDYPAQLAENNNQIENLTTQLNSQSLLENTVDASVQAQLREKSAAAEAARQQLDPQIASLEQSVQNLNQQINILSTNPTITPIEKRPRLAELQAALTLRTQQIAQLKQQRANIATEAFNLTRIINSRSQRSRSQLIQNQTAIQEQIAFLREENSRIELSQQESRNSLAQLNQQLEQAQKALKEQQQKIRQLEEQVRSRENP